MTSRRALRLIVVVAALEPLQIAHGAVEIAAHLLDLGVERPALRRLSGEQRKEAAAFAALLVRLHQQAVEVGLLFGDRILVALDLVGPRRIGGAAVDHRQLALEPHAGGVGSRRPAGRRSGLRGGRGGQRQQAKSRAEDATAETA